MIECKTTSGDLINNEQVPSANLNSTLSLTWLWEVIVRTKRLPDDLDPTALFVVLRDRLRNPEREVRQHALRVLADLIPVVDQDILDKQMNVIVSELVVNLAYVAPSVRKGAVDVFKIYLKNSLNPNDVLRKLLTSSITDDSNLKLGLIMAVPHLIVHQITEETVAFVVHQLFLATDHQLLLETSLSSLVKIRRNLSTDKFNRLIGRKFVDEFEELCRNNNITLEESNVILETEITLEAGPAITMKIHEENNFHSTSSDSEEELKLIDSDVEVTRSPRKVHFGGEVVKMRTPESDSNLASDNDQVHSMEIDRPTSIKITVSEGVTIKTRHRSLIPVRISTFSTSQPSSPAKKLGPQRLNRSAPDLGRSLSKIPLRSRTHANQPHQPNRVRRNSRVGDEFSSTPIHNEIEVFHNLTRSPTKTKEKQPAIERHFDRNKIDQKPQPNDGGKPEEYSYESFQVFTGDQLNVRTPETAYPSFQVYEETKKGETNPLTLILHDLIHEEDIWNKNRHMDSLISLLHQQPRLVPLAQIFDTLLSLDQHPRLQNKVQESLSLALNVGNAHDLNSTIIKRICVVGDVKLALKMMQSTSPRSFFKDLDEPNEGVLQVLIAASRTFPSSDIDVVKGVQLATAALMDNRRKIRQAALEALASLAQVANNTVVLETVMQTTNSPELLRIVRTRLSRKQLPTLDQEGNIRYSSPREKEELDWLCGGGTNCNSDNDGGKNFWKRKSSNDESSKDQVWAIESSTLPKIEKANLCPVYVLHNKGTSYKKYDRGRSNTPPPNHQQSSSENRVPHKERFRKSFSSEQIYHGNTKHPETTSFSLSSRSSTTSTGSSTRSGLWLKSGIPVPVLSDKIKFRHRHPSEIHGGPLMAQEPMARTKFDSPQVTPMMARFSPQQVPTIQPLPPPSSGSESSGYFTPPAEHHLKDSAIERFNHDEHYHKADVKTPVPHNFQVVVVDSDESQVETHFLRQSSISSVSEGTEKLETTEDDQDQIPVKHSLIHFDLTDNLDFSEARNKSRSELNLRSSLPDITERKNVNSAPPLNDISIVPYSFPETPHTTPVKASLPGSCQEQQTPIVKKKLESPSPRRLVKRSVSNKSLKKKSNRPAKNENVRPFSRPKDALNQALGQMENCDWETTMQGLNNLVRLSRYHPEIVESQMHAICVALARNIKNLRSQVARNACNVTSELFATCKRSLDVELEELAGPLLQRTADTNKFLRSDANAALDSMTLHLPVARVVAVIAHKGSTHQNGVVRAASTRLLGEMATRLGPERIFQLPKETRDKFLLVGANGLTEGSLENRRHAKALVAILAIHPQFQRALLEAVPQHTLRHISKIINSLKV